MAYDFITRQEMQDALKQERQFLLSLLEARDEEIELIKDSTPKWLTTNQACEFLKVSRPTLLKERDKSGSLIEVSYEGEKGGTVLYNAESLRQYKKSKTVKRPRLAAA